jgi:hypothetical protein
VCFGNPERRPTRACTRPPTRWMSSTFRVAGRRVMPGVRSPERAAPILRAFRGGALRRSNKRMHATADTLPVINLHGLGRRVMRGVRCFILPGAQLVTVGLYDERRLCQVDPGLISHRSRLGSLGRGSRVCPAGRGEHRPGRGGALRVGLRPRGAGPHREVMAPGGDASNNGMHPTRDTNDFMLLQRCGRAGDAGR